MLEKLNDRERLFLFAGGVVIAAVLLIVGVTTVLQHRAKLKEDVQQARKELVQIREMTSLIQRLPSGRQAPGQDQMKNELRQLMSNLGLEHSSLNANTVQMDGGQEKIQVDINFNSVKLVDVFKLLYELEVTGQVSARVEELRLQRPFSKKEVYDVRLKVFVQRPSRGEER